MGTREPLPMEQKHVLDCGGGRAPRGAKVVARERLPVGCKHVRVRGERAISS